MCIHTDTTHTHTHAHAHTHTHTHTHMRVELPPSFVATHTNKHLHKDTTHTHTHTHAHINMAIYAYIFVQINLHPCALAGAKKPANEAYTTLCCSDLLPRNSCRTLGMLSPNTAHKSIFMSQREREKKKKGREIKRISRNSFQLSTRSRKSKKL